MSASVLSAERQEKKHSKQTLHAMFINGRNVQRNFPYENIDRSGTLNE